MRALLDSALDAVITVDRRGRILEFNHAAERIFGYRRDDMVGRTIEQTIVPHDLRGRNRAGLQAYLSGRADRILDRRIEVTAARADGSEFPVELSVARVHGEDPPLFCATLRDITERKRTERQLAEAKRQTRLDSSGLAPVAPISEMKRTEEALRNANKELEAFSYSISHDLRTPLRAMSGYANQLLEDHEERLDDDGVQLVRRIRDNAGRMGLMIDGLLAFSSLGGQEIRHELVNLDRMLDRVLEELRPSAGQREVRFHTQPLPPALGDETLLQQVLVNLLSNAIKFTTQESPAEIEIGGTEGSESHTYWVRDNGVGFDMDHADKLFDVFQRLHGSTEYEGTGIGLALVKRIIRGHGGEVWAEGRPGQGATFHFSLPAQGEGG